MPLPANVAKAIDKHLGKGTVPEVGWYVDKKSVCEGAAFHSPTPLTILHHALAPNGDASGPVASLCPTCAANLSVLQSLLVATSGDLPWSVRREFGNKIRALAMRGWEWQGGD